MGLSSRLATHDELLTRDGGYTRQVSSQLFANLVGGPPPTGGRSLDQDNGAGHGVAGPSCAGGGRLRGGAC